MEIGSQYLGDGRCQFTVWAPLLKQVALHLVSPTDHLIPLKQNDQGYWQVTVEAEPGTRYFYQLDGEVDRPDPASHFQPEGVHGPSEVVDHHHFAWMDQAWKGISLEQMVVYELHVGTFTPEGTFEAIIPRIPDLKALGITAIELLPVAQFPGDRNWGYDGVYLYGVQNSYGGVDGLKQLVNACHQQDMAILLDVVYNHLGPEGNYLWSYGPYFTDRYRTPWGSAVNYDDAYSDGVRNFIIENTRYWLQQYHFDGLRLDAVHAIYDFGAKHILQELEEAAVQISHDRGYKLQLIAESDLNDPRIIRPTSLGGYGIDAQWSDDFHHALHTLLTGESQGYYEDFGSLEQLVKAYREGFVYTWDYSPHRKRYHGNRPRDCDFRQFVVCSQNHDQVGNRMLGDRLAHLVSFEAQKLAAAAVILSPFVPMLFMGEEYGEPAPFQYFVSHTDPVLVEAVRQGRKAEFAAFHATGEAPDPQASETFERSKLQWNKRQEGNHKLLWQFYQALLQLRHTLPALVSLDQNSVDVEVQLPEKVLKLRRWQGDRQVLCLMSFNPESVHLKMTLPPGTWKKQLNSADPQWGGPGVHLPDVIPTQRETTISQQEFLLSPQSVVVYTN